MKYMKLGMSKLEFDTWKKDWYIRVPKCEKFVCCHELMSCGIKVFCGDCSIFGTYSVDKNPRECTTVGCEDCINKYSCPDYGVNRETYMEEKRFRREEDPFREMRRREEQRKELIPKKEPRETKESIPKRELQTKREDSLVKSFLNKDIVLMMRGGSKLIGKLESVASYELLVTINYNPVIVLKHAVDYITLFEEGKEKPKEFLEPLKEQIKEPLKV